jgi:hypothetical protein
MLRSAPTLRPAHASSHADVDAAWSPVRGAPARTRAPDDSAEATSAASPPREADAPEPADDSSRLMVLLAVFVVSPLVVVGALWAVAAINTSWALIGALGVYATTTLVVFATVAWVLSDHLPLHGRRRAGA